MTGVNIADELIVNQLFPFIAANAPNVNLRLAFQFRVFNRNIVNPRAFYWALFSKFSLDFV